MEFEFKPLVVERCVSCKRFFFKGRLVSVPLEVVVKSHFKDFNVKSVVFDDDYDSFSKLPRKLHSKIVFLNDNEEFFFDFDFSSKNFLCKDCQKKKSNYFEATLQLRNVSDKTVFEKVKTLISDFGDVVKEEKFFKNGVDFKITSNKVLRKVLKELEKNFIGFSKLSSKLHTKDRLTQKEKHRLTGLFSFSNFQKGDVILLDSFPFLVKGFQKGKVLLYNIVKNEDKSVLLKDINDSRKLSLFESSVIKVKPYITIFDENFQDVKAKSLVKVNVNDKVLVLNFEGEYFIIRKF